MQQNLKKGLIYILFFAIGIIIFWRLYRDIKLDELKAVLINLNYWWIILCVLIGISSHVIRALRWNMLIQSIGYKVRLMNTFLAILVLYFTNLIFPRAGEIARCTVLTKYDKVPFAKLVGTVVMERITDVIVTLIITTIIFSINLNVLIHFLYNHPQLQAKFFKIFSLPNTLIAISLIIIALIIILTVKPFKNTKIEERIKRIKNNLFEGIGSITKLKNRWLYIFYSFLIFIFYLLMLYVVFFAFKPTSQLSIWTAMFVFLMGTFAMFAPVQGGIGAYNFMIMEALLLFGIDEKNGKLFALIAQTSTSLVFIVIGLFAVILLPILNRKKVN